MKPAWKFWAAVAPSFVAVAAIAVRAELLLASAVEVRLEVRPYDPMDALSGRYVAAPLAIARLEVDTLRNECPTASTGDTVWVALEPGEPWWRPAAVLCAPRADTLALRGVLREQRGSWWTIDYQIERFFIPHDAADPSEFTGGARPQIVAVLRIDASGAGLLTDLRVDGEPYADWNARQQEQREQKEREALDSVEQDDEER